MAAQASVDAAPLSHSNDEANAEGAADGQPHASVPATMKAWTYRHYRGGASALSVRKAVLLLTASASNACAVSDNVLSIADLDGSCSSTRSFQYRRLAAGAC